MSWVWKVSGGSLRKIWEWGRSVKKLYQGCWMKDKRSGMCKYVKAFWSNSKLNPNCWKELLLAMSHESFSTIHYQTAEPWMEKRIVTKTQKGEGVQVQNQDDDDRFFLMSMELSMQNSCHKAKLLISTSLKTSCDIWCSQWGQKEENCGKQGHGCYIITMLQLIMPWKFGSFLPKITLLYWSNHPTLQIWSL